MVLTNKKHDKLTHTINIPVFGKILAGGKILARQVKILSSLKNQAEF
jgi:hypothetical protein